MDTSFKKILIIIPSLLITAFLYSQDKDFNPINTAVPSLGIAPEARGGGMGDIGAATLPDVYSQHWNPAKYAFAESPAGVAISYTPWLSKLVNDIALIYAVGYYKFGYDQNHSISASIRYFTMGDIPLYDETGYFYSSASPHEFAIDLGYSTKLTETFSGAVALRYIRTDYTTDNESDQTPGNAFAADIAGYNESYVMIGQVESLLGFGFNISNIGSKVSNNGGDNSYFIPTNLRLGVSLTYPLDDYNTLAFNADINKLLVPTPPIREEDESDTEFKERQKEYREGSSISGIFKSFTDAPGGFSEELKEINWSLGMEYTYNNQFSIRGGYYNEDKMKGNRKYFSFGAGLRMSAFQIDASYLVSTAQNNPLDQTLRFSLSFDMEGLRGLFK